MIKNKYKALFIAVLAALFLLACSSAEKKPEPEVDEQKSNSYYQLGLAALRQGDYIKAKREISHAIEYAPHLPQYYNHLGLIFLLEHDYANAEKNFRKTLDVDKSFTDAHNNLGMLFLETGELDKALEEFNTVLGDTMYPYPHYAETNIGAVYRLKRNYDEAKKHLEAALKMRGTHCEAYKQMGLLYDEQRLDDLALENYKKTLEYCSYNVEIIYRAAQKLYIRQKEKSAKIYLRRCLEVNAANRSQVTIPFLPECLDFANQLGVVLDEPKQDRPTQQIEDAQ